MNDHQPLSDYVCSESKNHRRNAKVSHTDSINQTNRETAHKACGNGQQGAGWSPAACAGGHHTANRDDPRDREVNMAEQDHKHEARGDDPEKGGDLELLQKILGGEKVRRVE